jgi:hypothetical protein
VLTSASSSNRQRTVSGGRSSSLLMPDSTFRCTRQARLGDARARAAKSTAAVVRGGSEARQRGQEEAEGQQERCQVQEVGRSGCGRVDAAACARGCFGRDAARRGRPDGRRLYRCRRASPSAIRTGNQCCRARLALGFGCDARILGDPVGGHPPVCRRRQGEAAPAGQAGVDTQTGVSRRWKRLNIDSGSLLASSCDDGRRRRTGGAATGGGDGGR